MIHKRETVFVIVALGSVLGGVTPVVIGADAQAKGVAVGACCHPDGSCTDEPPGSCTGISLGAGTSCSETICPVDDSCVWENGAPGSTGVISQFSGHSDARVANEAYVVAADDFAFNGGLISLCSLDTLVVYFQHVNADVFGCGNVGLCSQVSDPTCAPCDPVAAEPCGVGSVSTDCELIPCANDPSDYSGILVAIMNDASEAGPAPNGPNGVPTSSTVPCAGDSDCACLFDATPAGPSLCGLNDTCEDNAGTEILVPDGGFTAWKNLLTVSPSEYTWAPGALPGTYEVTIDFTGFSADIETNKKNWLAVAPVVGLTGFYQTAWMASTNTNGIDARVTDDSAAPGDTWGTVTGLDLAFTLTGVGTVIEPGCATDADCIVDAGGTAFAGIDTCRYQYCDNGLCLTCARDYGQTCPLFSTTIGVSDILCAIAGFSDYFACPNGDIVGGDGPVGPLGPSGPNGLPISVSDILAVVAAFDGDNPAGCPETSGDPASCDLVTSVPPGGCGNSATSASADSKPAWSRSVDASRSAPLVGDEVVDARFVLVPRQRSVRAGGFVDVDVFVSGVEGLVGFEMSVHTSGGRRGGLTLDSITMDTQRHDYVFNGLYNFPAVDSKLGRLGGALMGTGVDVAKSDRAYVGTFRFAVSADAAGTFNVAASTEFTGLWSDGNQAVAINPVDDGNVSVSNRVEKR
jgi:hypothetical protein